MHSPLPDGTVIQNRYRVERVLGQGGFGRTYLAIDTNRFNEFCVLKEFAPQDQSTANLRKAEDLFTREAGVLYQLRHPQIPRFREMFRVHYLNRELLFLAQDYIEGTTYEALMDSRQGQGFSEAEILQLLHQILPVLTYIHSAGIVHRDIAPDNIILRSTDQQPVLIDFGVVKALANKLAQPAAHYSSHTLVGKPGYASPEQLQAGTANPSSDLYALAVTCIVLLTGREPQSLYDPVTLTWLWQQYATVNPELTFVLNRLLSYKPSDRYPSANDVLAVLSPLKIQPVPVARSAAPVPTSLTQQNTLALVGRRRATTVVKNNSAGQSAGSPHQQIQQTGRSPNLLNAILHTPVWMVKGTAYLIGSTVRGVFGIIKFTVWGTLKLIYRLIIFGLVIALLAWAVPQILALVPKIAPALKLAQGSKPTAKQSQGSDLETRCKELGLDYAAFVRSVNDQFYTKYPDQKGKLLSSDEKDQGMRDEWNTIADELLKKSGQGGDDAGTLRRNRQFVKKVAESE